MFVVVTARTQMSRMTLLLSRPQLRMRRGLVRESADKDVQAPQRQPRRATTGKVEVPELDALKRKISLHRPRVMADNLEEAGYSP